MSEVLSTDRCRMDVFDPETFFREHWRRKPLYVPGGGRALVDRRWTTADFDAARFRMMEDDQVMERPGEVIFIEDVSRFDDDLAARARQLAHFFGAPQVWFDAIRTYDRSGIGAHFDHSDNIVLQQSGTKEWSVASPQHIPRADIARRMMNVPGVGGRELPADGVLRFTLEPGDLLYLPLFWLHSGTSRAESLSISVVCPSVPLHRAVLPLLAEAAHGQALGHQPIPAFHAYLPADERAAAARRLREATGALLRRLSDDELVDAVHALQTRRLPGLDGGAAPVAQ